MSKASLDFIKNPLVFMKTNIISIDNADAWMSTSGEYNLDLAEAGVGQNSVGDTAVHYRLVKSKDGTDAVSAYFLAFKDGGIECKTLDTTRKFFFTAGLTGCGFAVGGPPGAPLVKHIDGGSKTDEQMLKDPSNAGMKVLTKKGYADSDNDDGYGMCTVFGFKPGEHWEFWAQPRFCTPGPKYQLAIPGGVRKV